MKTKLRLLICLMTIISAHIFSNTITTGTIAGSPFCQCSTVNVPFTSTGTFNSSNIYTAELSDALGSFAMPSIIGTIASTANSGTITCTLPCNTPAGTNYLINVVSSNPGVTGTNNGVAITINVSQDASFAYSSSTFCQSGTNAIPTIFGTNGGSFSSSAGLVFVSTSTGEINMASCILGTYNVTYTTTGLCPATSTNTVTITNAPNASFVFNPTSFCQFGTNPSPAFTAGGSGGVFSAAPAGLVFVSTSTGEIDLSLSAAGTYTVTNFISASGACPAATSTFSITIDATSAATFSYTGSPYCQSGINPTPTFASGSAAGTFTSAPAGLFIVSGTGAIDLALSTPGTYTVTNFVTNVGGCPSTVATAPITITTAPCATFGYANTPYCQSAANPSPTLGAGCASGVFTSSPAGLIFVNSTTGDVNLGASTPGTYTITNTIAASGGCPAAIATSTIVINASPVVTVNSPTICSGSTATLVAVGATTYTWSAGASASGVNTATASPLLTTTYTVTGTTGTCTGTAVATVTVIVCNYPLANYGAAPLVNCYAGSPVCVTYTDSSTNNPTSWQWSFPGGVPNSANTQGPINVCYSAFGAYTSMLIVTNSMGASDTLLRVNYLSVVAPIQPNITGNAWVGSVITVMPAGNSYQWRLNGGVIPSATSQSITITQVGVYSVDYVDINGCSSTSYVTVGIDELPNSADIILEPNPNNGIFNLEFLTKNSSKNIQLEIFNFLGEKVYSSIIGNQKTEIDLCKRAKGIYFVRIEDENKNVVNRKIVVQ